MNAPDVIESDATEPRPVEGRTRAPRRAAATRGLTARLGRAAEIGARHVSENPLAAIAGAAAVSAGLALLLPAGRREAEVMGEVAGKLGEVARDTADGVVAAGRAEVETLAQSALASVGETVVGALVTAERA